MSEEIKKIEENRLPTIQELYASDTKNILVKEAIFKDLVNQPPAESWIKDHPFAKKVKYLPIDKVEWLLTNLFVSWKVEVKEIQLIANAVTVTVRLHYKNRITNEWDWQDGIGAVGLQTDKDAGASDWNKIKSDAVMKGAPAAESYAIKDAAEKIGRIFGSDLNRNDTVGYNLSEKFKDYSNLENRERKTYHQRKMKEREEEQEANGSKELFD